MSARRFRLRPRSTAPGLAAAALASLVDLLTILLVVLLRTWSSEAPLDLPEAAQLPISRAEDPTGPGVIVDIGQRGLYVDGRRAGSVAFHLQSEDAVVHEVGEALSARGGQRVLLRADEGTPWPLISKVLLSAQQAGYREIELVAVSAASL